MARRARDKDERREEALRPDRRIGYGRDRLGQYFLSRQAYEFAASQFRRAVWLNPFEPAFKAHLAWCLFKQGRTAEAQVWINQALAQAPEDEESRQLAAWIAEGTSEGGRGNDSGDKTACRNVP